MFWGLNSQSEQGGDLPGLILQTSAIVIRIIPKIYWIVLWPETHILRKIWIRIVIQFLDTVQKSDHPQNLMDCFSVPRHTSGDCCMLNPFIILWVLLQTDRQTDRRTDRKQNHHDLKYNLFGRGNYQVIRYVLRSTVSKSIINSPLQ